MDGADQRAIDAERYLTSVRAKAKRPDAHTAKPGFAGQLVEWARRRVARWLAPKGPDYLAAGSYRYLARQIDADLPCAAGGRTILMSSPVNADAGNSTVLMFSYFLRQELGCRILLIDGTFQETGAGTALGHGEAQGLLDLAYGSVHALDTVILPTRHEGIAILPPGRISERTMQPIPMERIADLFRQARCSYDYILLQQGPLFKDSRYLDFTREADLILMLVEEGWTHVGDLEQSMKILRDHQISGARILMTTPT